MGWIVVATSFSFVVTQLDVTIVNVALPHIASSLSVHVAGLQWVVDAYTLPFAVLMLSAGVSGGRFGSRQTYLIGLAIFAADSLACGLAPNAATRNLLFLAIREEKQIPRFARDDTKYFFRSL